MRESSETRTLQPQPQQTELKELWKAASTTAHTGSHKGNWKTLTRSPDHSPDPVFTAAAPTQATSRARIFTASESRPGARQTHTSGIDKTGQRPEKSRQTRHWFFTEPSRLHGLQPDRQPTAVAPPVGRDRGDVAGSADTRRREKRRLAADPCDVHTVLETKPLHPTHTSPEPPGPASPQHQSHGVPRRARMRSALAKNTADALRQQARGPLHPRGSSAAGAPAPPAAGVARGRRSSRPRAQKSRKAAPRQRAP